VATAPGAFCDKECFSQGLTASQFKKIGTQLSTFACGVSNPELGTISGYQLSNGTATCSVASPTVAESATDYSCLCQVGSLSPLPVQDNPSPHLFPPSVTCNHEASIQCEVRRKSHRTPPPPRATNIKSDSSDVLQ